MKLDLSKYKFKDYSQEPQKLNLLFSFCDLVGEDIIKPRYYGVLCRDFLIDDYVWSIQNVRHHLLYKFCIENNIPLQLDKFRLLICVADKDLVFNEEMFYALKLYYQDVADMSWFEFKQKNQLFYYIEASDFWLKSTVHLSFLTFLLKRCFQPESTFATIFKNVSQWESNYDTPKKLSAFLSIITQLPDLGPLNALSTDKHIIHNNSGFLSCMHDYKYKSTVYGESVKKLMDELLLCAA